MAPTRADAPWAIRSPAQHGALGAMIPTLAAEPQRAADGRRTRPAHSRAAEPRRRKGSTPPAT